MLPGNPATTSPQTENQEEGPPLSTSMITKLALIAPATVAATIGLVATAHADDSYAFQSPSGNIGCTMTTKVASCEIENYTWFIPRPPDYQMGGRGNVFLLGQGSAPIAGVWHSDHEFPDGSPTLNYGQRRTVGTITCDSETSGVTCTDSSTGHFFRVSRDSYQVG
jgi:hypothetical protein